MALLTACSCDAMIFTRPQKEVEHVVLRSIDEESVFETLCRDSVPQ